MLISMGILLHAFFTECVYNIICINRYWFIIYFLIVRFTDATLHLIHSHTKKRFIIYYGKYFNN